jgi:hypothetical protein
MTLVGQFLSTTDAQFATNRYALGQALAVIPEPENALPLVFRGVNGSTGVLTQKLCRPVDLDVPLTRSHARKYAPYVVRFEAVDPLLYSLALHSQIFSVPSDSQVLNNAGNNPTGWRATLVGPAELPIITNEDTSQVISFETLVIAGDETLVLDSCGCTIKVNGVDVSYDLASGFAWWDLPPGNSEISFEATNADTASFSIIWRDAYWIT